MPKPYAVDAGCVELTAPRQPDHSRQPGRWIQDIDQRKEPAMYLLDYTTARVLITPRAATPTTKPTVRNPNINCWNMY